MFLVLYTSFLLTNTHIFLKILMMVVCSTIQFVLRGPKETTTAGFF